MPQVRVEVGRVIADWRLVRPLGAGASARVWLARGDGHPDDLVAIKLLRPHGFDVARARFDREARVLSTLHHAAIVGYRTHGTLDDQETCFLVMDLVDGEDLAARIERGRMPVGQARRLFLDVADGLAHAHAHGIFHRDLKPQNLRVRPNGAGVVLDFGIAVEEGGAQLTQEGMLPGTIGYFPPEVFDRGGRPDPRLCDIYALGLLLWEVVEGRYAFPAEEGRSTRQQSVRIIGEKMERRHLPISSDVPADLRDLIERATHPDPALRLSSMAGFAERLSGAEPARSVGRGHSATVWSNDEDDELLQPDVPPRRAGPPAPPPARRAVEATVFTRLPGRDEITAEHPCDDPLPVPESVPDPPAAEIAAPRAGRGNPVRVLLLGAAMALAVAGVGIVATVAMLSSQGGGAEVATTPTREAPPRVSVAIEVAHPVDVVRSAGGVAERGPDAWLLELEPGDHEVLVARGPACTADDPVCGPCCACARHMVHVGAESLRVALEAPPPPDPGPRPLHVTLLGSPGAAGVSVRIGGEGVSASDDGSFRGLVPVGQPSTVQVDVGTCTEAASGCAGEAVCPAGCWSVVVPVASACGTEPDELPIPIRPPEAPKAAGRAEARPRATSTAPAVAPVEPEAKPVQALRVSVRGEKLGGMLPEEAVDVYARGLRGRAEACWRRQPGPYATLPPAVVGFKVKAGGATDDVQLEAATGETLVDACLRALVRDTAIPDGKPGKARVTFRLTVE